MPQASVKMFFLDDPNWPPQPPVEPPPAGHPDRSIMRTQHMQKLGGLLLALQFVKELFS